MTVIFNVLGITHNVFAIVPTLYTVTVANWSGSVLDFTEKSCFSGRKHRRHGGSEGLESVPTFPVSGEKSLS